MKPPIDFYFDFSSPYGYFAATRIDGIAARHGRDVTWRPILLGAVFKVSGQQPLPSIPLKGEYTKRDLDRCARYLRVPFQLPSKFPIAGQTPSRAFYWLNERDPRGARKLALALFHASFVNGLDISSPDVTIEVGAGMGLGTTELEMALNDAAVKDRLRREVDTAISRGVFGSPYVLIDGEPFWGADRLDHIEKWLATGGW